MSAAAGEQKSEKANYSRLQHYRLKALLLPPLQNAGGLTERFSFEQGVCQGCILSPLHSNACGEAIMRQGKETEDQSLDSIVSG